MSRDEMPPLPLPDKQGCEDDPLYGITPVDYYTADQMRAYAALVAERARTEKREACARVCDDLGDEWDDPAERHGMRLCAAAIRALG